MKKITKKLWGLVLSFVFTITLLSNPVGAYAAEQPSAEAETRNGYKGIEAIELTDEEYQELVESEEYQAEGMVSEVYGSRDYSGYASYTCRGNLTAIEQAFYNNLYNAANYYLTTNATAPSISGSYTIGRVSFEGISTQRAKDLTYVFIFQNPQFYFLEGRIYYSSSSSEVAICVYDIFGNGYARENVTGQIFSKVDDWISQINNYSSNYSKLLKAQHIVCANTEYVFNDYDQTAYSAIILGKSVCAGYAKFYSLLANGAGFDCLSVTSYDHAWNVVNLDGTYYNVDTTWDDDEYSDIPYVDYFLTSDSYIISGHFREDPYYEIAPLCNSNHANQGDLTLDSSGIYVAANDKDHVFAGMDTLISYSGEDIEYRWIACNELDKAWFEVQGWTENNEWVDWYPEKYGNYILVCQARVSGYEDVYVEKSVGIEHHPYIKGRCQMPYTGEGGGYLIGFETYDNPGGEYRYEMLILDCTLLLEGKPAWVYTTGQCFVPESSFWTVWQPLYGYYWTLFRVYDADGNLIDEACFGFQNI